MKKPLDFLQKRLARQPLSVPENGREELIRIEDLVKIYDTGALKEWATTAFDENNEHRHLSHLYCAWPLMETRGNARLTAACKQAVENRKSENEASHALVHRSLIAARLQDRAALTDALVNLMNHKIRYDSLMTNHDYDRGSCYCTDFAIGYLGIVHEALVYSNDDEIELLPALPESGFDRGTLTGLKTRNRATVTRLQWDLEAGTVQAVLTDAPLPLDPPQPPAAQPCGQCGACLRACPVGALDGEKVDVSKCLRALAEGQPVPRSLWPLLGNSLLGCDLCQQVCPRGREGEREPMPPELARALDLPSLLAVQVRPLVPWIGANYARK